MSYVLLFIIFYLQLLDINECLLETDTCEHNCYNTIGSFNCDCQQGYTLNDGFFCSGKKLIIVKYIHSQLKLR